MKDVLQDVVPRCASEFFLKEFCARVNNSKDSSSSDDSDHALLLSEYLVIVICFQL